MKKEAGEKALAEILKCEISECEVVNTHEYFKNHKEMMKFLSMLDESIILIKEPVDLQQTKMITYFDSTTDRDILPVLIVTSDDDVVGYGYSED
jgi:hypothetical protein